MHPVRTGPVQGFPALYMLGRIQNRHRPLRAFAPTTFILGHYSRMTLR